PRQCVASEVGYNGPKTSQSRPSSRDEVIVGTTTEQSTSCPSMPRTASSETLRQDLYLRVKHSATSKNRRSEASFMSFVSINTELPRGSVALVEDMNELWWEVGMMSNRADYLSY